MFSGTYPKIVEELKKGDKSSYEIAKTLGVTQGAIWQNLERLQKLKVVDSEEDNHLWSLKSDELLKLIAVEEEKLKKDFSEIKLQIYKVRGLKNIVKK